MTQPIRKWQQRRKIKRSTPVVVEEDEDAAADDAADADALLMLLLFSPSIDHACMHSCPFARSLTHSLTHSQLDQFVFGKVVIIGRGSLGPFVTIRSIIISSIILGISSIRSIVAGIASSICIVVIIAAVAVAKHHPDGHVRIDLLGTTAGRIDVAFFPRLDDPSGPALEVVAGTTGCSAPNVLHDGDGVSHREPIAGGSVPHRKGGRALSMEEWQCRGTAHYRRRFGRSEPIEILPRGTTSVRVRV